MVHNVFITKELSLVINSVTSKFNIEQIYINTYKREYTPYELIILVSNKYVRTLGEVVPKIVNTIREFPEFKVLCYVAFQAKDKIREGNLFLFTSCQPNKIVYKREESVFEIISKDLDFNKCEELATGLLDREQQKINDFKDGYYHFKELGKYPIAGFMLHQVIELTYRNLELFLLGKERITHSIRSHHLYLKDINVDYNGVFDDENEEDINLLQMLENIYRATRYEDNFYVDIEMLGQIESKMKTLIVHSKEIIDKALGRFEEIGETYLKIVHEQLQVESTKESVEDINSLCCLVNRMKEYLLIDTAIYLFGQRKRSFFMEGIAATVDDGDTHYDLFIVSDVDIRERVANLQANLNESLDVSVLLISFTKEQVQKQLDNNSLFFHKALQFNTPLFCSENLQFDPCFHENNGIAVIEDDRIKIAWYNRQRNAKAFLHGGARIDESEEIGVKVLLYNQAIEQACLGLLEFYLGYNPYQYNLKHLYDLCCSFWVFPNDIFPRSTVEEISLFNDLVDTVQDVRYKGNTDVDWDEAYRYEARCERFLEECSEIVLGTFSES